MNMKRAVGYCQNQGLTEQEACEDFAKGVFLLNHGDTFYCPGCRHIGLIQKETGFADRHGNAPFKEVRVEFNYEPLSARFKEIAIVRDEAIWGSGSRYTLRSPLIKTERRALKVAEAILANLQKHAELADDGGIPRTSEIILSFDEDIETFTRRVRQLGRDWEKSNLVERDYRQDKPDPDSKHLMDEFVLD